MIRLPENDTCWEVDINGDDIRTVEYWVKEKGTLGGADIIWKDGTKKSINAEQANFLYTYLTQIN